MGDPARNEQRILRFPSSPPQWNSQPLFMANRCAG